LPGLYITMKSCSRNNNNHLAIILETCGLLTNRPMSYDLHKKQTFCLANNVWTCANKKPLLNLSFYYVIIYSTLFRSLKTYIISWSFFPITFWNNITPTINKDAFLWTWNSTCQFGDINIDASIYFYLINSQDLWHSFI
jgi:hypothetical protein